jgi:hypothetical protein
MVVWVTRMRSKREKMWTKVRIFGQSGPGTLLDLTKYSGSDLGQKPGNGWIAGGLLMTNLVSKNLQAICFV